MGSRAKKKSHEKQAREQSSQPLGEILEKHWIRRRWSATAYSRTRDSTSGKSS